MRNSIVLCNSVSADRSGVVASRFLAAAGACIILLCFAAESRKSYCSQWQHESFEWGSGSRFFSILVLMIFLFKFLLQSASKSSFFRLAVELPVLELQICVAALRTSIAFCNSVSADRSGMAASRFLAAAGACVILVFCN